jgi:hypothetical protein
MSSTSTEAVVMKSPFPHALAFIALLLGLSVAQQSFAAARATDIDPARDRVGQIVYALGVHPPKNAGTTKGVAAKYPKAQGAARDKDKTSE